MCVLCVAFEADSRQCERIGGTIWENLVGSVPHGEDDPSPDRHSIAYVCLASPLLEVCDDI